MSNSRPKISIPLSKLELFLYFLGLAAIIFMIVLFCTAYMDLPQSVPTHWNFAGEVDAYGSKSTYLWVTLIGIVTYIAIAALSFFPHIFNYPVEVTEQNAERLYRTGRVWMNVINAEMIWMFAAIFGCGIYGAATGSDNLTMPIVMSICGVLLVSCIVMSVQLARAGKKKEE